MVDEGPGSLESRLGNIEVTGDPNGMGTVAGYVAETLRAFENCSALTEGSGADANSSFDGPIKAFYTALQEVIGDGQESITKAELDGITGQVGGDFIE